MDRDERREARQSRSRDKAAEVVVEVVDAETIKAQEPTPGKPAGVPPPTEVELMADRLTKIEDRLTAIEDTLGAVVNSLATISEMVDSGLYQGRIPKGRAHRQAP